MSKSPGSLVTLAKNVRSYALGRTFLPESLEKPDDFIPLIAERTILSQILIISLNLTTFTNMEFAKKVS